MSFFASNGRIRVTNTGGATVFDTDRRMPHIVRTITGSIVLPAQTLSRGSTTYNLGFAGEGANFLFPSLNATFSYGSTTNNAPIGLQSGVSYACSGSVVLLSRWAWDPGDGASSDTIEFSGARILSVGIQDGNCILVDQWAEDYGITHQPVTLAYKIYLGTFT